MAVRVDLQACLGCRLCVSSCPLGLLETNRDFKITVRDGCTECGACLPACPYGYLSLEQSPPF